MTGRPDPLGRPDRRDHPDHFDHLGHFVREIRAFERVVRDVGEAPPVPSCPGWTVTDLVMHLGGVHRWLSLILDQRMLTPPEPGDMAFLGLPPQSATWPDPQHAPNRGPVPDGMVDWFAEGAAALAGHFRQDATVWTWSAEQSVAFWRRMQAIEAALHRWDAQLAVTGSPEPLDAGLAADAVAQTFEVMAPARRAWRHAPPGQGERYLLRQSDGPGRWAYAFQDDAVDRTETGAVELTGTASDLALFLWQRIPAERLAVKGDESLVDRYFTLVPPV